MLPFTAFLLVLILFIQHRLVDCVEIPKPHPSCTYIHEEPPTPTFIPGMMMPPPPRDNYHAQFTLRCTEASLEIPTNFNVSQFPSDVRAVYLDCPASDNNQTDPYCNIMNYNAQPLPLLSELRRVSMLRFTTQNRTRFPINELLANVKHQITELGIEHSKIGSLDAEYFKGFYALIYLNLLENDIAEIAPNTFQQISETPGSSVLRKLRISRNHVSSFDWAVLEPLANSLKWFAFTNQKPGLQNITRSIPKFTFKKSVNLELYGNALSAIPKEILDSMELKSHSDDDSVNLSIEGNPFCPLSSNCSCCEMKPFFDWLHSDVRNAKDDLRVYLTYDCGPSDNMDQIKTYSLRAENSTFELRTGKRFSSFETSYGYPENFDPADVTPC